MPGPGQLEGNWLELNTQILQCVTQNAKGSTAAGVVGCAAPASATSGNPNGSTAGPGNMLAGNTLGVVGCRASHPAPERAAPPGGSAAVAGGDESNPNGSLTTATVAGTAGAGRVGNTAGDTPPPAPRGGVNGGRDAGNWKCGGTYGPESPRDDIAAARAATPCAPRMPWDSGIPGKNGALLSTVAAGGAAANAGAASEITSPDGAYDPEPLE